MRRVITAEVVGLALIGEPLAVFGWLASAGVSSASTSLGTDYPVLWVGEMVVGFVLCCGVMARGVRPRKRCKSALTTTRSRWDAKRFSELTPRGCLAPPTPSVGPRLQLVATFCHGAPGP